MLWAIIQALFLPVGYIYQYNQKIFLDGKVANLVYITLMKIVPAQSGIC